MALGPWIAWCGALIEHTSGRPAPVRVVALYGALGWGAAVVWIAARVWWLRGALEGIEGLTTLRPSISLESLELGEAGMRGAFVAALVVVAP